MNKQLSQWFEIDLHDYITEKDFVLDNLFMASPFDYENGMSEYYTQILQNLPTGVSCLLVHIGFDNVEMKGVTDGVVPYGSAWRQSDFDFLQV